MKVADESAGKKVKCPGCGKVVVVPDKVPAAARNQATAALPNADSPRTRGDFSPGPVANAQEATIVPAASPSTQDTGTQYYLDSPPADRGAAPVEVQGTSESRSLGGYRILRELGHGGMGTVYEAEDVKLERHVALKVMKKEIARSQQDRDRFLREARTAAKVESDFICPIYQVGEDNGVPFIAMPLLKGEPLDERLKDGTELAIDEVIRIGKEVAEGLSAAHEVGLIHRDIKPANIWLETQRSGPPRARILDFGLARLQADEAQITQSGDIVGTPAYMSPEQAHGDKNLNARTDLFSLGSVLYLLCTGQRPFKGDTTMAVLTALATKDPTPPHEVSEIPEPLSDLILRLLAKEPTNRPRTARDVIEELAEIEQDLGKPEKAKRITATTPSQDKSAVSRDAKRSADLDKSSPTGQAAMAGKRLAKTQKLLPLDEAPRPPCARLS